MRLRTFIAAAGRFGNAAETILLVLILGSMILLAFAQIVLRNFLDMGLPFGDELLRMLVLWVALAGAVAASRADKHINIAVLDRFLPATMKKLLQLVMQLFTCGICFIVAWFSLQFVLTSKEYGDLILGHVPAWWLQSALPLGFALISWRYLMFLLAGITHWFSGEEAT